METTKVYGDRTCKNCKGICHRNSYRRAVGTRKSYFCGITCLRNYLNNELKNSCKKSGSTNWWDVKYTEKEMNDMVNSFFEPIEVIAK